MTAKELKELIANLHDDAEVEINSVYQDGEWSSSPVAEAHYCVADNKVYITPEVVSI